MLINGAHKHAACSINGMTRQRNVTRTRKVTVEGAPGCRDGVHPNVISVEHNHATDELKVTSDIGQTENGDTLTQSTIYRSSAWVSYTVVDVSDSP